MKRILALTLITVFNISYFIAKPPVKKLALIVAIGNYEEATGWKKISSLNDVALISGALESQGFSKSDITVIRDAEASKQGIIDALMELKMKAEKGDIVVVHFSSHGQQIEDNNRDELDGLDEAIVGFGAPAYFDEGYNGENHLRDEELGERLDDIREKIGRDGDVLVLVDACHSGTATRGHEKTRGGVPAYVSKDFKPKEVKKADIGMFEKNKPTSRGSSNMAPMVVISGSRADETNKEFEGAGSLSVAFSRSFQNLNSNYSYRSLFSKIAKEMSVIAPKQTPAIEGDIDRLLFGGKVVTQELYYGILSLDQDAIVINGGVFTGLNEETTIKVYPSGTINTKGIDPITTGTITFAEGFECNAILDKPLEGNSADFWVFVDQKTFGDVTIKVNLDRINNAELKSNLNTFLESFPLANVTGDNAEFYLTESGSRVNMTRVSNDEIFKTQIPTQDGFRKLKGILSSYAQGKFLKGLELSNPDYNIELALIPVRMKGKTVKDTLDISTKLDDGGMPQFSTKDTVIIRITNNSSFPVYFNIIDIQPDGIINPILPNPRESHNAIDFKIGANETYDVRGKYVYFNPPYGVETFKIFASYQPLNFSPIFMTKGAGGTRGNLSNEVEKLFADSYSMSRGADVGSLSASTDACTYSYTFKIIRATK
jgi:hypothetical protein